MKPSKSLSTLATALIAGSHVVNAIEVDLTSPGLYSIHTLVLLY